jgi:hypothetical protein
MKMVDPERQSFKAKLAAGGEGEAWVVLPIPFDVAARFGSRGRVPVSGSLNGIPFRNSIFPSGDGTHHMMINKALQRDAGCGPDALVEIVMQVDLAPRAEETPPDLRDALSAEPQAAAFFEKLSDSSRNEFIRWITSAKRDDTRAERVAKTLARLQAGKRRISG